MYIDLTLTQGLCFNTQPPEGGWLGFRPSRCKKYCFNTQPPEGGWFSYDALFCLRYGFNTQPPEGGWSRILGISTVSISVSTHSRPKAAGGFGRIISRNY